jgi:hypothetical protein
VGEEHLPAQHDIAPFYADSFVRYWLAQVQLSCALVPAR